MKIKMTTQLSDKQILFCKEYLVDLNSSAAARRAGYSKKTANEQGARLLANVSIQKTIRQLMEERGQRIEATADYVLSELLSIASDDIKNYLDFHATPTGRVKIRLKNSQAISTKNISLISVDKKGTFRFKLYSRENALIQIGRHLGMFEDRISIKTHLEKMLSEYTENGVLTQEGINRLSEIILEQHKKLGK